MAKQTDSAMSLWVKCFFVATAVTMAGLIPAPAEPRLTFAQAGSTGGTIGKQDKSASGSDVHVPARVRRAPLARKHHVPKQVLRASKPEWQSKRMPRKSPATPRMAVGGRWNWNATCAFGNWGGVITLVQTTASPFHGSFGGQGPADNGIITHGTIRGKHISFRRHDGAVELGVRYDAELVSVEPPTFKGYHVHPITGACQFIGTKM